jgi:hypothetical protein
VTFLLVRRLGGSAWVAWVATALVLFVPCNQMAASMVGNEAFAAGVAALALPALVRLQADPRDLRAAAVAGLAAGLAAATKVTGLSVVAGCAVPFVRRPVDRRILAALGIAAATAALVAGPVYVRNALLTGSVLPMTRLLQPMRRAEAVQILRGRRLGDYVRIDPECLLRPSVFHVARVPGRYRNRNRAMTSVPGLLYASTWYDAFGHRIPLRYHRDGVTAGPALTLLGLVPTIVMLLGFAAAVACAVRSRGRAADAPLVAVALVGLAMLAAHTWRAPSTAAVKAAYLLQLAAPAGVVFARGMGLLGPRLRVAVLVASAVAAVAAALVSTDGLVFSTEPMGPGQVRMWGVWAAKLPSSNIAEAMRLLTPARR